MSIACDGQYPYNSSVHLLKIKFSNRKSIITSGGGASHHHVILYFDAWSGKIWYYELYDSDLDKQYGFLSLHEQAPETSELIKNPRVGSINLNGFSLRAGIRISF